MEFITGLYRTVRAMLPFWAAVASGSAAAAIVTALVITLFLKRWLFLRRLKQVQNNPELAGPVIRDRFSARALLRRSGLVEKFARTTGPAVVGLIGIDVLWVDRLVAHRRRRDFRRVLTLAPAKGLFKCFLLSLDRKRLAGLLLIWIAREQDYRTLSLLALSGKGEQFNGRKACAVFKKLLPLIREMPGNPEWPARYFAVKILLYDSDERSERAVWEALHDPYPLVRKTLCQEFRPADDERFHRELFDLYLRDPVYEVRRAAWRRILSQHANRDALKADTLTSLEALHALELLRVESKADENLALAYLAGDDLELRFLAARHLERSGALERLCLEVDFGDRDGLERNTSLLRKAGQVNVTSFLAVADRTHNPATLSVCSQILGETGDRALIGGIARKAFRAPDASPEHEQLYRAILQAIYRRGDDEALRLMDRELVKRKSEGRFLGMLLTCVPGRNDIFLDTLFMFFRNPEFPAKRRLREALRRMPTPLILDELFRILRADRDRFPHQVRIQAYALLAEMRLPYCLQTLLENLPILPLQEAREFAAVLAEFPRGLFIQRVEHLLESTDSPIRAALIAVLPVTADKEFLPAIRKALKDSDPEVRIAGIWALVEYGDTRSLNQAVSMLRDPVERVRREVARALGGNAADDVLDTLQEMLEDDNEVTEVKRAALVGLGASLSLRSIDILCARLEQGQELLPEMKTALSRKIGRDEIARLIERFKDASQKVRGHISDAFVLMRQQGENMLVGLLREHITSLTPFIAEVMEATGFIESTVGRLKHRDSKCRRSAAEVLALIGTESAFRGMVIAARDPDEEVRVQVVRALEKLETTEGKRILAALQKDPDKRIRKYTHWALQRLKAKSL